MKPGDSSNISSVNLGLLFNKNHLFGDIDADGYADKTNVDLAVAPGLKSGVVWAGLINLAARFNMECSGEAFAAPVCLTKTKARTLLVHQPSMSSAKAACLTGSVGEGWILTGNSAGAMNLLLNSLAVEAIHNYGTLANRLEISNENLRKCSVCWDGEQADCIVEIEWSIEKKARAVLTDKPVIDLISPDSAIFVGSEKEPRGTRLALEVELPEEISLVCARAAFSLMGAASTLATEVVLPLAFAATVSVSKYCLKLVENDSQEAWLQQEGAYLLATGGKKQLARLLQELQRLWLETDAPGGENLESWRSHFRRAALMAAGKGIEGEIAHGLVKGTNLPALVGKNWSKAETACRLLGLPAPPIIPAKKSIVRRASWQSEEQRLLAEAQKIPDGGGEVDCQVFIGGGYETRKRLSKTLQKVLQKKGYEPRISVIRSHKPAVSWLLEEIEPTLPATINNLHISFSPFDRPGQLELRSRWGQEMYPAPDIICKRRGWGNERVEMAVDHNQQQAYVVRGFDSGQKLIFEKELAPPVTQLAYLLEGDDNRFTYPVSVSLSVEKESQSIWSKQIPTDREMFWHRFQQVWLPEMEAAMVAALPELRQQKALAFWEEIRLDIVIQEEQENLELAQERIAPMEALHEDIYFGLLAFCTAFCKEHCPDSPLQMGRILPMVRSVQHKKPHARLKLKTSSTLSSEFVSKPDLKRIGYSQGRMTAQIHCDENPLTTTELKQLCVVAKAWGYNLIPRINALLVSKRPVLVNKKTKPPVVEIQKPDVESIPSGEEIRSWTWGLDGKPGIKVWGAGHSIMGRSIVAAEATSSSRMSAGRARLLKPTLFINARHHANEISGSNAALSLLYELACGHKAAITLAQANVVVVPVENADGVATFEEMSAENPDHKLHAARYNALGMEWYDQYFNPDTPFTEALVKARLYDRWLPEYMLDLHGVPSHEWEQPFAGYINPHFQEHWIPRSFVYAILPYYDDEKHPGGIEARAIASELSAAMAEESDLVEQNKEVYDRYQRYGKAFEPELFHSSLEGTLVVVPTSNRINENNYANRKWPLVKSEIITEVLDEVARGPWLRRCTKAHLVTIDTMLRRMCRTNKASLQRQSLPEGVLFAWRNDAVKNPG